MAAKRADIYVENAFTAGGHCQNCKTGYDWVAYGQVAERVDNLRGGLASLGISLKCCFLQQETKN